MKSDQYHYRHIYGAVSHRKRLYTAKLRLKIRLSVIIDPGTPIINSPLSTLTINIL
jgi:hypothetical protein